MDIMLLAPALDSQTCKTIKMMMPAIYFNDRPKQEAIDVFVRTEDAYPLRASIDITDQVSDILGRYNDMLAPPTFRAT